VIPIPAAGLLATLMLIAFPAAGHDLQHTAVHAQALVIQMHYADGSPFAFESYEVYRDGEKVPQQVGRTDRAGRIAFLPDGPATWRIKAFSEDGHGFDIRVGSGAGGTVEAADRPLFDRVTRIFVGVAVILALFAALSLFYRRRAA
jgi:nickel transport protein